jgi:2-keto-4-pentenoate hydratase/2-oxohepta-3-ene-1,7-dioic acid hydratase in catechol pathway
MGVKICRFERGGDVRVGVVLDGSTVLDCGPWADFVLGGGTRSPADLPVNGPQFPLSRLNLLAPVTPSKGVGIGLNYLSHAQEGGLEPGEHPMVFGVTPNAIAGPGQIITYPSWTEKLDYEGELGVVIGKRAERVLAADAMDHVFGYTCVNDLSARDWQFSNNWLFGKSADGLMPIGPWVVTTDEIPDPYALRLVTRVDGSVRQDESTSGMLHDISRLIEFVSRSVTLEVGDVISTGTPAGVGILQEGWLLRPGSIVEVEIDGIGTLTTTIAT